MLLHLTQREKKQIVHFPSLMFVRRIPYQSVRRRKIHNWLLLMVRLAALRSSSWHSLARSFARSSRAVWRRLARGRRVARQQLQHGFGDHWRRAMQAARDQINKLSASDRARWCCSRQAPTSSCVRPRKNLA